MRLTELLRDVAGRMEVYADGSFETATYDRRILLRNGDTSFFALYYARNTSHLCLSKAGEVEGRELYFPVAQRLLSPEIQERVTGSRDTTLNDWRRLLLDALNYLSVQSEGAWPEEVQSYGWEIVS